MATDEERITAINIDEEMKTSYLLYSMSVIVARALPDVRDGLKPVQRRILRAMDDLNLSPTAQWRKSAKVAGDTSGNYHPHGEQVIYPTIVRMAQEFNARYPLVMGQGNLGCFTGDTKIKLLDGTERSFEELARLAPDEVFYVYSVDRHGRIVVGEGRHARITRRKVPLVGVTLDSGETIRCTPDHRFLLRDGTYKEASALTPQDSLMPGYFDTAPVKEGLNEYLRVYQPASEEWELAPAVETAGYLRYEVGLRRLMPSVREGGLRAPGGPRFQPPRRRPAAASPNHRAVRVRPLDETADVYDITVDEHHNFLLSCGVFVHNSIDGDPPAAMRYTEVRMSALAMEMLADIDKNTVDFQPNYDQSRQEPVVLPGRFPNLLANGCSGIAVGMATNIPPHNLSELVDAITLWIDKPTATVDELMEKMPGPDFPTAALILGKRGIRQAYETGRGAVTMQAKTQIEPMDGGKSAIVVTELPYQVNKQKLIEHIADLVKAKKLDGITGLNDYTDKNGMRIVIELRRDAHPQRILNYLLKHTALRQNFGVLMLALVDGAPRVLALSQVISNYVKHRQEIVRRRTEFDLEAAKRRAHIVEGLLKAIDVIDEIIRIIRASRTVEVARRDLIATFDFSEVQAQAILEMQLQRLVNLERQKLQDEYRDLIQKITTLEGILADPAKVLTIIKDELKELKRKFGDARRTRIVPMEADEIGDEDTIPEEETIVTITRNGYIKRVAHDTYRVQKRGGRGVLAASSKEEDEIAHLFVATTHHYILFFTDRGRVYRLKAYELPVGSRQAMGTAIINLISIEPGEAITATVPLKALDGNGYLVMGTERGEVKRSSLSEFQNLRTNGLRAFDIEENDALRWVLHTDGKQEIFLATAMGQAIRFPESELRAAGRAAGGVRGITLTGDDRVIGMEIAPPDRDMLVVSENGYGKRTSLKEYPTHHRGGKGMFTMRVTPKTGRIADIKVVTDDDRLLIMTAGGIVIRVRVAEIRRIGRATEGVRLINLAPDDRVVSIERVAAKQEVETSASISPDGAQPQLGLNGDSDDEDEA